MARGEAWLELVDWLRLALEDALTRRGLDADTATDVADESALHLIGEFAGLNIYIPLTSTAIRQQRDRSIYREWLAAPESERGNVVRRLAREHGLSFGGVYGSIKRAREAAVRGGIATETEVSAWRADRQPALAAAHRSAF